MSVLQAIHSLHGLYDSGIYAVVAPMGNGQSVVKIGRSMDPMARFAALLPGIPFPCKMYYLSLGTIAVAAHYEKKLHRKFKTRKTRGEWFLFDDADGHLLMDELEKVHKKLRPSVKFKLREITSSMAVKASFERSERNRQPTGA